MSRPIHVYDIKDLDGDNARVSGVVATKDGVLAVVNENHSTVHLFDSHRQHAHKFSISEYDGRNELYVVSQMGVDHKGNLACITFNGDMFRYNLNGKRIPSFVQEESSWQQILGGAPVGFTVRGTGMVALSYAHPNKICCVELDDPLTSLCTIYDDNDCDGLKHDDPFGAICFGPDGHLYVASESCILAFDKNGTICREIQMEGRLKYPESIFVSGEGHIFVADYEDNKVRVVSHDGGIVHEFGGKGKEEGCFDKPIGITVGYDGYLYVADSGNGRVQVF